MTIKPDTARDILQDLVAAFPQLDTDHEDVSGADAVDFLTGIRLRAREVLAEPAPKKIASPMRQALESLRAALRTMPDVDPFAHGPLAEADSLAEIALAETTDDAALDIQEADWSDAAFEDDPTARLTADVTICGTPMHADAWAVVRDADDRQRPAEWAGSEDDFDLLMSVMDVSDFKTTTIGGREYVVFVTPHSA